MQPMNASGNKTPASNDSTDTRLPFAICMAFATAGVFLAGEPDTAAVFAIITALVFGYVAFRNSLDRLRTVWRNGR